MLNQNCKEDFKVIYLCCWLYGGWISSELKLKQDFAKSDETELKIEKK